MPTARATSLPDNRRGLVPEGTAAQVLVTRPEPGAFETAGRITALGFTPIMASVLAIRPITARLPARNAIVAILLTSGSAIAALPEEYHTLPVLTVGDGTAARARAAGFGQVFSADGDATSLAALVAERLRPQGGGLLLAVGKFQGQALAEDLRAAGFRVLRRAVYTTAPARDLTPAVVEALRAGTVCAALFFSAETARQFARLAQQAGVAETFRTVDAVSIGRPAAVALEALPWRRISVAARPNQDEMLALLR